jgi:hypothetical protein
MRRLSARDVRALTFIGEGYEVAQYQLQETVFARLSPTVVSRFVRRTVAASLIIAMRVNGTGMNRLRLTPRGRDALLDAGCLATRVFAPRRPVAEKDWVHTLRTNDLRVVLGMRSHPPAELLAAWALQRELAAEVVPDLLAMWRRPNGEAVLLACEIDRGTENLTTVFLPKLRRLADMLRETADERYGILVLTEGERRAGRLRTVAGHLRVIVEHLPKQSGPEALRALRAVFDE